MNGHTDTDSNRDDASDTVTRRSLLRASAATVATASGLAVASGSATAQWWRPDIDEVDLRDGVPAVDAAPQDEAEVVFNVHGYSGSSASRSQTRTLRSTLEELGYETSYAAVTWDDSGGPISALSGARDAGDRFAAWLDDYLAANPSTDVRVLGHSMGGIVTMETLAAVDGHFRIENADQIGSYVRDDAVCEGGQFYEPIVDSCAAAYNYHSSNDRIARLGSDGADCVGWYGSGDPPDNYEDVDVSEYVRSHLSYKRSTGCVAAIADNWASTESVDRDADALGDNVAYDDADDGWDGGWFSR